jgi:hypothetical protein
LSREAQPQLPTVNTELNRLVKDASYSAQAYFEAAKSAEFWGRGIVFAPALIGTLASLLVAVGQPKVWGALGAVAGAVAATASFLGSDKRAASMKESARRFTVLRHRARVELSFLDENANSDVSEQKVRDLWEEYASIAMSSEPVPNRHFQRARVRIQSGILKYGDAKEQR